MIQLANIKGGTIRRAAAVAPNSQAVNEHRAADFTLKVKSTIGTVTVNCETAAIDDEVAAAGDKMSQVCRQSDVGCHINCVRSRGIHAINRRIQSSIGINIVAGRHCRACHQAQCGHKG